MNIYDYIKLDHEHVNKLFKLFKKANSLIRQKQTVDYLCGELLAHLHSEQDTFYKTLRENNATGSLMDHAQHEHHEIEEKINKIYNSKQSDAQWLMDVEELKKEIEHHVNEEENKVFCEAKKVLLSDEAYALKEKMHYLKMDYLLALKRTKNPSD